MIVIRALDGIAVDVDEDTVTLVSGPYPHDVGAHTYVHGVERGVLVTAESAAALAARLGVNPPLAKLTRPNATPVWIKGSAVTTLRTPRHTARVSQLNKRKSPDARHANLWPVCRDPL